MPNLAGFICQTVAYPGLSLRSNRWAAMRTPSALPVTNDCKIYGMTLFFARIRKPLPSFFHLYFRLLPPTA